MDATGSEAEFKRTNRKPAYPIGAFSYSHGVDLITNWVEITISGSDSVVMADRDGTDAPAA